MEYFLKISLLLKKYIDSNIDRVMFGNIDNITNRKEILRTSVKGTNKIVHIHTH